METKKNPSQDVHRQSLKFFLIGIGISVSLVITAFEWTTEKVKYPGGVVTDSLLESTITILPPLNELPKTTPILAKRNPASPKIFTPTALPDNATDPNPDVHVVDEVPEINTGTISYDLPKEDSTEIIFLAEVQPKPVGGYELFYSKLSKNLKYPRQAIRHGVAGKVFVEFVVDRNGKVNQIKVLKGIGAGCDEEAMRVLTLPQWEPGKQRGRPVNVRMVMPVIFNVQ
jgi:periplasmic protein TonB